MLISKKDKRPNLPAHAGGHSLLPDVVKELWHEKFYLVDLGGQDGDVYNTVTAALQLDFKFTVVERLDFPRGEGIDYQETIPSGADLLYSRSSAQYRSTTYSEILSALPKWILFFQHPLSKHINSPVCKQGDGDDYREYWRTYTLEETTEMLSKEYTLQSHAYLWDEYTRGPGTLEFYNILYKRNG